MKFPGACFFSLGGAANCCVYKRQVQNLQRLQNQKVPSGLPLVLGIRIKSPIHLPPGSSV